MMVLKYVILFLVTAVLMLALGNAVSAADLVYDDFNDGSLGTNTGGSCGPMSPGGLYDPRLVFERDAHEGAFSLSLQYDFPAGQWCGYWSAFTAGQTAYDVSSYDRLEMWVKGENGGEKFKVELSDIYFDPNNYMATQYHKMAIRIVDAPDGSFRLGLGTQWKKLSLPLSLFTASPSQLDLSKLKLVNIVFDEHPRTGKIYVDAITFVQSKSSLSILPSSQRVGILENFTCSVIIKPATEVDFLQFDLVFDPSLLTLVKAEEGEFENGDISSFSFENRGPGLVRFSVIGGARGISSAATVARIVFRAAGFEGTSVISIQNQLLLEISDTQQRMLPTEVESSEVVIRTFLRWDVNRDENVDYLDLVAVVANWGRAGPPGWMRADLNADGVIDVCDLVIVAQRIVR